MLALSRQKWAGAVLDLCSWRDVVCGILILVNGFSRPLGFQFIIFTQNLHSHDLQNYI